KAPRSRPGPVQSDARSEDRTVLEAALLLADRHYRPPPTRYPGPNLSGQLLLRARPVPRQGKRGPLFRPAEGTRHAARARAWHLDQLLSRLLADRAGSPPAASGGAGALRSINEKRADRPHARPERHHRHRFS